MRRACGRDHRKPDSPGRFGQREQGNAGEGRHRAQTPRGKLEVVLEHARTPAAPPAGEGISYLCEGRLVRLGLGLRSRPWARTGARGAVSSSALASHELGP